MTITFSPFKSQTGFSSPGFFVTPTGDLSFSGQLLTDQQFRINGISILEADDSTVSLSTDIKNSSLTNLGQLERLRVQGDLEVTDLTNTVNLSIIDGVVTISSEDVGSLNNIDIGQINPALGSFTTLSADAGNIFLFTAVTATIDNLTASQNTIVDATITTATITTATITAATIIDGTVSELIANNIEITQQPTELYHATRKDYVDNRISALSIALGS